MMVCAIVVFFPVCLVRVKRPGSGQKVVIDLENSKRADHLARHNVVTDVEMKQTALSLRPQYFSAGTSISPIESVSMRVFGFESGVACDIGFLSSAAWQPDIYSPS